VRLPRPQKLRYNNDKNKSNDISSSLCRFNIGEPNGTIALIRAPFIVRRVKPGEALYSIQSVIESKALSYLLKYRKQYYNLIEKGRFKSFISFIFK